MMNERRQQILYILHQKKFVTVERLCKELYSSPATIRRDLADMAEQGMLSRLRGGAELLEGSNNDMPLLLRIQKEKEKKEIIATLAADYLENTSTIFMDSSSTIYYLAVQLKNYSARSVITNGLATMNYLNQHTAATVYCTGGQLFHQSSFVGNHALDTVKSYCADAFFFSCCGFSVKNGSTEAEEENAVVKRAMCENAKKKILLCDSTKLNHDYFCKACPADSIDLIIMDKKPDEETIEALGEKLIYKKGAVSKVSPRKEQG
jgi:DeoR/GlpR family transcriptional regulator of sugar metabolism